MRLFMKTPKQISISDQEIDLEKAIAAALGSVNTISEL